MIAPRERCIDPESGSMVLMNTPGVRGHGMLEQIPPGIERIPPKVEQLPRGVERIPRGTEQIPRVSSYGTAINANATTGIPPMNKVLSADVAPLAPGLQQVDGVQQQQ